MKLVQKKSAKKIQAELQKELGDGPMRFGPVHVEPHLREQLLASGIEGFNAYASLTAVWSETAVSRKKKYTDEQIFRVLRYTRFSESRALSTLKRMDPRRLNLNSYDQLEQLESKTLFPIPGLKTLEGSNCFYMRPCRYYPNETPTSKIIDNLAYVMETYASRDPELKTGIAFIANMNEWTFENFNTEYCRKFMMMLQGRTYCAKVNLFLIVNPPGWFGKIWAIMKGMLSTKFQQKVHMIHEEELPFFFKPGFEKYPPDEFIEGEASTDKMVSDFISYQNAMEKATGKVSISKALFNRNGTNGSGPSMLRKFFSRGPMKTPTDESPEEANDATEFSEYNSYSKSPSVAVR